MQTTVEVMKLEIAAKTKFMLSYNSLFQSLKDRTPLKQELAQYLINVHYLITFTQPNLRSALLKSTQIFDKNLAQYFFDKIFEEIGHEKWAEDDIRSNQISVSANQDKPVPAMIKLTEYLTRIASDSPLQYATYILVSEYMTSNFGHEVLKLFRALPKDTNTLSVLSKHVDLDVEHSHGDEEKLELLLAHISESEFEKLMGTIEYSISLIDQSFQEIYEYSQPKSISSSIASPASRELGNI